MNEIVRIQHREAVTTSRKVADVFGKKHQHVMEAIRNIECPVDFARSNFRQIFFDDSYGRKQPAYEITRDGFSFLAMGFTGKKAAEFKIKFIKAFNQMEKALLNQQNLSWQEQRTENKIARRVATDTIAKFVEYATAQGSHSAQMYFMNITKMTHQALFLIKQASPQPFRDMLDSMQLLFLTTAEYLVQQALLDGMEAALHYKDIYVLARQRVEHYAAQLPKQRLLVTV